MTYNLITDLTYIEVVSHSKQVMIHHEVRLRCPVCLTVFILRCVTDVANAEEQAEEIINSKRAELYYNHLLDCTGKRGGA